MHLFCVSNTHDISKSVLIFLYNRFIQSLAISLKQILALLLKND